MKTILEVVRDLIKPYIDKNANNIAPVEDSPVENPYYAGDQLIYKGVLYNVTSDIAIGDDLDTNTNISVAPKINSSVKSVLSKLRSNGASSGTDFNFDIQNGVAGWNSATTRDAATFHPFSAGSTASDISYTNTTSGLTATNVQNAIDEVDGNVDNAVTNINKKLPTYANGTSSWDTTPTQNSTKPVTSGGIYTALRQMSYVGMIIHSTTFNTEAKVKAFYGGTKWIQHSGYVLRGATSGVTANSATKTGGNDNAIVVKHNHTQNPHYHVPANGTNFAVYGASGANQFRFIGTEDNNGNFTGATNSVTATNNETGEDGTNKNIPNYKSVYIWERTQ
jgi:hypothetical protein